MPDPVAAFEVAGLGALRRYLQVRRDEALRSLRWAESGKMQDMQRALALAIAGHGQSVAVFEAGAGKSRLLFEFSRALPPEPAGFLEAYGISHAKGVPWVPVIDMLTSYFDIRSNDDAATRREEFA